MQIAKNTVVSFHYTLADPDGGPIESSEGGEPSLYLHGAHGILPALETALSGHVAGERVEVTLNADQAYGPRR